MKCCTVVEYCFPDNSSNFDTSQVQIDWLAAILNAENVWLHETVCPAVCPASDLRDGTWNLSESLTNHKVPWWADARLFRILIRFKMTAWHWKKWSKKAKNCPFCNFIYVRNQISDMAHGIFLRLWVIVKYYCELMHVFLEFWKNPRWPPGIEKKTAILNRGDIKQLLLIF